MKLDAAKTALLIMDFQNDIVNNFASDQDGLLERTARLRAAARQVGALIVYVVVAFRDGYPEISATNAAFSGLKQSGRFVAGTPGATVHPRLAPEAGDVTVVKRRVSAFSGSDLELVLRAGGRDTLILTGIATSGVVLSTLRQAADQDYTLFVARDACSDRDDEVHRVLVDKVFPRQAAVHTVDELIASMA